MHFLKLAWLKNGLQCLIHGPPRHEHNLFDSIDNDFFHGIKTNSNHVLQPYLPDKTEIPYRLRTRSHNMTLINKTKFLSDADFLTRMLYKYSY